MIPEVHQVAVMAPEREHVQRLRSAASCERAFACLVERLAVEAVNFVDIGFIGSPAVHAFTALVFGHSQIVALDRVQVRVQRRRAFDDFGSDIGTVLISFITVVIRQAVKRQIEVRDSEFRIGHYRAVRVIALDRNTIEGDPILIVTDSAGV